MRFPTISVEELPTAPLFGELRYGFELAGLLATREFRRPAGSSEGPPVLLVPGFMAGDSSLSVLGDWLRRRGSRVARSGILLNSDCSERTMAGIESRLQRLAEGAGGRVALIGQSRGGALARVAAQRRPDLVGALVMLGSPVRAPLCVDPLVLGTLRSVARLGDLGVPRMLSSECHDGSCCAEFREDLLAPLDPDVRAVAIYSRSDAIVAWQACLDPCAEHVEVASSHTGMSVNQQVYGVLAKVLDEEAERWSG